MLRIISISLMLVLSIGIMLPFANSAHGIRQTTEIGQPRHHRYRSRAWWRRYRARLRQKRLAAELAHRNKLLSLPQNISGGDLSALSQPAMPSVPANVTTESVSAPANNATRPRVVNAAHSTFKTEVSNY